MDNLALVQARMSSSRFPGKVLLKIGKKSILQILLSRLSKSKKIDKIVVCTSKNESDDLIFKESKKIKFEIFRGSENNVLDRFYKAAKKYKAKNIIRITADCPLIDPGEIDRLIKIHSEKKLDYTSNNNPATYPDGLDAEVFTMETLKYTCLNAISDYDKEHVTTYIKKTDKFKKFNFEYKKNLSNLRLTLDYPKDFILIKKIIDGFKGNLHFSLEDLLKKYSPQNIIYNINNNYKRNEGSKMNYFQKLWTRAEQIIPGGTSLFSKNPNLFLPKKWPTYFSKTKGCYVWDLENKKYLDMSYMGVGTNILGYNNKIVDRAVIQAIQKGNLATLNSPEEVYLAEKLLQLMPWASKVKFTRSGGEASTVALRISRAASGKDKVMICGYHGWHDWYLAANLNNSNALNNHLMNQVPIKGVPKNLNKNIVVFKSNDINDFKKKISEHKDIGTVFMEVARNSYPKKKYLKRIRDICNKKKINLIFDECTTGFRETIAGLHNKYNVTPDITIFGKTLGNGFAINAIVGNEKVMTYANNSFISSTFWSERTGYVAGVKTLEILKRKKPWVQILKMGKLLKKKIRYLAKKNLLKIKVYGIDSIPTYIFKYENDLAYRTLVTQEMLKEKILATNSVYLCTKHTNLMLNKYLSCLDKVFNLIKKCEIKKINIREVLKSPVRISGIRN